VKAVPVRLSSVAVGGATATDDSRSGTRYAGGHPYAGHGTTYVDVLRDRFGP
jgi:hypothetical protein